MPATPYVQTVSCEDATYEDVKKAIPLRAGAVHIEVSDSIITVNSEHEFEL